MSAAVASVTASSLVLFVVLTAVGALTWLGTLDRDVRTDLVIEGPDEILVIGREPYMWRMLGSRLLFVAFLAGVGQLTFMAPSPNAQLTVIAVFLAGVYALTGVRHLNLSVNRVRHAQGSLTPIAQVVTIAAGTATLNDHGVFAVAVAWLRRVLGI